MASLDDMDQDMQLFLPQISCAYFTEDTVNKFLEPKGLTILHVNCRSMNANFDSLLNLLHNFDVLPEIIAVSETWLSTETDSLYNIEGYDFVSRPRNSKSLGGGVGIYYKNELNARICPELCSSICIECVFIEIVQQGSPNIIVGAIYRPPNNDIVQFNAEFHNLLGKLSLVAKKNTNIALAGDFNIDLLLADSSSSTQLFLDNLSSYSFVPTISLPTRITSSSSTLLDNVFVNSLSTTISSAIIFSDISDHLPILVKLPAKLAPRQSNTTQMTRSVNTVSINAFIAALQAQRWDNVLDAINDPLSAPHVAYALFSLTFLQLYDRHFPLRSTKTGSKLSPRKEWMTRGLAKSCFRKSKLYRNSLSDPSKLAFYVAYRNRLKSLLRIAEKSYYDAKLASYSGDLKRTWSLLRTIINPNSGTRVSSNCFIDGSGNRITESISIANLFNDFFVGVGASLANKIPASATPFNTYLKGSYHNSLFLTPTTPAEISSITNLLDSKLSSGFDGLSTSLLKQCISPIASILSELVNYSFYTGYFPDELKIAKVCPIYKAGDTNLVTNYRPISVLPGISKIYEKAMYNRLIAYLNRNNVIINNQYGFRAQHSTYMAVLDLYDKLSKAIENKLVSVGVFIDLQKAFDSLDHTILISKLQHYGIRGVARELFANYLNNRQQYVSFNGKESCLKPIVFGVPQGSILGPILFILYINDIIHCSPALYFILFADDTNLLASGSSCLEVMNKLNLELVKLAEWFKANKLSLNVSKTNFMIFGNKRVYIPDVNFAVLINDSPITRVSTVKFLGLLIDEGLSWKAHADYICTKLSKNVGVINRLKYKLNRATLKTLYSSLILPYLLYCVIIWGCASQLALDKLEKIQKRAIRVISGASYLAHTSSLFKAMNILKLRDLYHKEVAVFMYRFKFNILPYCCMHYVSLAIPGKYALRVEHDFIQEFMRTIIRLNSISGVGPRLWNLLPISLRSSSSLSLFKKHLLGYYTINYI